VRKLDFRINEDEILFIEAENGTVGVIQSGRPRTLFMNTPEDEIALFLEPHDLIVISAFMSGEGARRGIMALAYLLLEMENPLVVLPEDHPGSGRLRMVVSAADTINLDCSITPGTHPDHHLLCSCPELTGVEIRGEDGTIHLKNLPETVRVHSMRLRWP